VKVQPGQSRSGQAGSEPYLWPGDWLGMKRRQQGSGPRGFSSEIVRGCVAEVVDRAEGSIWIADNARLSGTPESLARGTLSKGFSRNLGDLLVSSCKGGCGSPSNKEPGPGRSQMHRHRERTSIWRKRYRQSRETRD
jgi:hypothetical protein